LINAAELSTYDHIKALLVSHLEMEEEAKQTHLVASSFAGFFGAIFSSPADVLKSRFMN